MAKRKPRPLATVASMTLRDHLTDYLASVGRGERFIISSKGVPVAALVPIADLERLESAK